MFGVTINLITRYNVYTTQTNRGRGDDRDIVELHYALKSKVFTSETNAIRWIITTIVDNLYEYESAIPSGWSRCNDSVCKNEANEEKAFIERVVNNVSKRNLTLDDVMEVLHSHWKSEQSYDNHDFHESRIIKFEVDAD